MSRTPNWAERLSELAVAADVTGAVLGVWADGEQSIVAHGVLNRSTGVEVTPDAVFQIGSVTKLWTATMVMQLVDEGRLSLDSTVADLVPGDPSGGRGLPSRCATCSRTPAESTETCSPIPAAVTTASTGMSASWGQCQQVFAPGAAYSYCNAGFVVLGRIIELLDGRTWDASLRARLVEPLGLASTVTLPEEAILHRAAVGHTSSGLPVHLWQLPRSIGPAGLITQSAADLLTFARTQLGNGA